MKKAFFLLILLMPWALMAKKKDKTQHMLPGRWVEVKRMKLDSTIVEFTDTLFMTFQIRDTFTYRLRNGFVYRGKYTYDDKDHLDFGTAHYDVALRRFNKSLILTNENGIYYFAVDTSDTAVVIVLKEDKIEPVTNIDQMIGHWTVYKRTTREGAIIDPDVNIKSVYITGPGTDDKQGYVYCMNDYDNDPKWFIKSLGSDQSLDVVGKSPRTIKVVKCQKGEMILEEGVATYYFKQFR